MLKDTKTLLIGYLFRLLRYIFVGKVFAYSLWYENSENRERLTEQREIGKGEINSHHKLKPNCLVSKQSL